MINDSVSIKDAFIINIGVEFEIIVRPGFNNNDVLTACINQLQVYFRTDNFQINEPIILSDLFPLLDGVDGVQTVKDIKIINKDGGNYSQFAYDIEGATINRVIYPSIDPMIFEVKFPNDDIKGKVVPL
jgi:phage-related baseplate assembly protein